MTTTPTVADFVFNRWDGIAASGFIAIATAPTVTVIPGGGVAGSSRVKIEFPDNAIRNTWLRVTMLANANTGLAANNVFYFGNAVGDMNVGNTGSPVTVQTSESDASAVRRNLSLAANSAAVINIYDLNKDGHVNAIDTSLTMQSQMARSIRFFTAPASLRLPITPTSSVSFKIEPTALAAGVGSASTQERRPEVSAYGSGSLVISAAISPSIRSRSSLTKLIAKPASASIAASKTLGSSSLKSVDAFFTSIEFSNL